MRVVFMGTPDFAVPSLERLAEAHDVRLVLTRPDAVRSRGKSLVPSPVAEAAERLGIPVAKCRRMDGEAIARMREAAPDVACVAAFGCIVPDEALAIPPLGCVNVHASLLPRWRGAAPIQRAMLAGDERVGVSIMRVVHDLDAGAWCRQASLEVGELTCPELTTRLASLGADELLSALDEMQAGTCAWEEQDPAQVTYAEKVGKAELLLLDEGFHQLRVRYHEGDIARIELNPKEFAHMFEDGRNLRVESALRKLGFAFVTLDLGGYATGKMNADEEQRLLSEKDDGSAGEAE